MTATAERYRMSDDLTVRRLTPGEPPPWELLLLADPSRPRVEVYLAAGLCCVATLAEAPPGEMRAGDATIGVFVLAATGARVYELMNIAAARSFADDDDNARTHPIDLPR